MTLMAHITKIFCHMKVVIQWWFPQKHLIILTKDM